MANQEHWEGIYTTKSSQRVSWYRPHLSQSLALIEGCDLPADAHIADVGAGASTLVDDLLTRGFEHVAVVDISASALELSKERLGDGANRVSWHVGDVTSPIFAADSIDLWHDRAVFHFLTENVRRDAYVAQVERALRPGGYVVIATFAPDGPARCSGLPVQQYDPAGIAAAFGPEFELVGGARETHETPGGSVQKFSYAVLCRRV